MEISQKVMCCQCNNEMEYVEAEEYYWCDECYKTIKIVALEPLNYRRDNN